MSRGVLHPCALCPRPGQRREDWWLCDEHYRRLCLIAAGVKAEEASVRQCNRCKGTPAILPRHYKFRSCARCRAKDKGYRAKAKKRRRRKVA